MTRLDTSTRLTLVLQLVAVLAGSCASQPAAPAAPPAPPAPPYSTTATLKDIMQLMVDPAADQVWQAVMTVDSAKGTVETVPRNDEDWKVARRGAVTLLEASNLLMIPGAAKPGEKPEARGRTGTGRDGGPETDSPYYKSLRLHDAAAPAIQAIDAKNAEKLFELGETIERACDTATELLVSEREDPDFLAHRPLRPLRCRDLRAIDYPAAAWSMAERSCLAAWPARQSTPPKARRRGRDDETPDRTASPSRTRRPGPLVRRMPGVRDGRTRQSPSLA
jgi:hypothetical protein